MDDIDQYPLEKSAAEAVARAVNRMGFNDAAFAEYMQHQHRTLQQNACRAFVECLKAWAKDANNGHYDLRNEDTVRFAKWVVDQAEKQGVVLGFRHV